MSGDPFLIDGPALISFSGGRSSAYMLWRILQAHGGTLPDDVRVAFANTGKEMPQTLNFVRDCSERWGVEVVWLEYADNDEAQRRWRRVSYAEASRDGAPFSALIARRRFLPSPPMRFCTIELKIRPMKLYAQQVLGWDHWSNVIGLRADEPHRVARMTGNAAHEVWDNLAPMHRAGITKRDVQGFWRQQNFDLALPVINGRSPHGNCDFCFLKSAATISALMREMPERARWWIDVEVNSTATTRSGRLFRIDRPSLAEMMKAVRDQQAFDFGDADEINDCFCGDPS